MGQVITKATQAQLFPRFVLLGQVEFASDLTLAPCHPDFHPDFLSSVLFQWHFLHPHSLAPSFLLPERQDWGSKISLQWPLWLVETDLLRREAMVPKIPTEKPTPHSLIVQQRCILQLDIQDTEDCSVWGLLFTPEQTRMGNLSPTSSARIRLCHHLRSDCLIAGGWF